MTTLTEAEVEETALELVGLVWRQARIASRAEHDDLTARLGRWQAPPRLIDLSSLSPTHRIGSEGGNAMAQCKARTARGTQCSRPAAAPSRSLCGTHQRALARGTRVTNAATGRVFPKPR